MTNENGGRQRTNAAFGCFLLLVVAMVLGYVLWWEPRNGEEPDPAPTWSAP